MRNIGLLKNSFEIIKNIKVTNVMIYLMLLLLFFNWDAVEIFVLNILN
jgi:hypothetical protein